MGASFRARPAVSLVFMPKECVRVLQIFERNLGAHLEKVWVVDAFNPLTAGRA